MPNARNLELTAREIDKAKPEHLDMSNWLELNTESECGASGCIAAYAIIAMIREEHREKGSTYNPTLQDVEPFYAWDRGRFPAQASKQSQRMARVGSLRDAGSI